MDVPGGSGGPLEETSFSVVFDGVLYSGYGDAIRVRYSDVTPCRVCPHPGPIGGFARGMDVDRARVQVRQSCWWFPTRDFLC